MSSTSACHSHHLRHLTPKMCVLQHFYCLRTLPFFSELLPPSHGGHCHCHFKQGSCSQLTFNSSFKQFYSQLSIISSFTCARYHREQDTSKRGGAYLPSSTLSWFIFSLNSAFHGWRRPISSYWWYWQVWRLYLIAYIKMHHSSIPLNLPSLFESGFVIADGSISLALSSFKQCYSQLSIISFFTCSNRISHVAGSPKNGAP